VTEDAAPPVPDDPAGDPAGTTGTAGDAGAATDEVRARLVRAAASVFAREGYAGTKIMDIVREAGVSTGTVYGRFRSKNELLREAVVGASTKAGVLASTARSLGELIRFGARLVDRPLYNFEALRLEAYVTARRESEVAQALADAYDRWRAGVAPLVTAAEADGEIADVDPEAVLFLYRTLYLGMLLHRASGLDGPDTDAWDAVVDRVVASLGRPAGDESTRHDETDEDGRGATARDHARDR
jgi:TetR/AcrR family acrAB operon transcriptional repressor